MAFEGLTEKISSAFKGLRSKGRLTEADVKDAMREIRMALLEADVNFKVAKDFIKAVTEKATDAEILDALQGVKLTQDEIRRGACGGMGLAFFRAYYEKLPEEVARRLTEIDTEAVEHITRATGLNLSGSLLDRFGEKMASDAAFAQVIRAANVYRGRLGYAPLGPDGWPEQGEATP